MSRERRPICDLCRGRRYPRQCRNSAVWRAAQRAPDVCPEGIALNNLPIGDNARSVAQGRDAGHCLFARPCRTCSQKVECHRHAAGTDGVVRSMARRTCRDCADRVERLHVAAVVTAHNEGDEVRRTVQSVADSIDRAFLDVIVVDDASSDGSCPPDQLARIGGRNVRVAVVRHQQAQGVGRSRNHGARLACERGAHVVSFHDAHMRFPSGGIEALALGALASDGIVCSASAGLHDDAPRWWGCDLFWNARDALQPKWRMKPPDGAWGRVPCPMGAAYVISVATVERLSRPTGRLWEDTAGRWGFSEQALAVKAFLMDVPVLVSRDVHTGHLYRERNPVPDAAREVWRNICRATAVLLPERIFQERFAAWCEHRLGSREFGRVASAAFEQRRELHWKRDPEDVFTHLCGRDAPVAEPHPDHRWLGDVAAATEALALRRAQGDGLRVLCWRPGEAMLRARRALPKAEVLAIECPGHRTANWRATCRRLGIALQTATLGSDYVLAPMAHSSSHGPFDFVLAGGEMQEECCEAARAMLAAGGTVLVNPSADRNLIEHEEAARERVFSARRQLDWEENAV